MHGAEGADAGELANDLRESVVGNRRHTLPPDDQRAKLLRIAVVCAAFVLVLGIGAFLSVRLMIEGPRQASPDAANRFSRVLYAMPDGTSCRVVLFDNKSSMMSEGPIVPCDPNRKSTSYIEPKEFTWGRK